MRMIKKQGLSRVALIAALGVLPLLGQGDRGQITGTVTDASGAVIPDAAIAVIQRDTNTSYKTRSTSAGVFTFPTLPIGEFQVTVERDGFKRYTSNNVMVT